MRIYSGMALTSAAMLTGLNMIAADVCANTSDRFELSGFARLVGGYLDSHQQTVEGYENSFALDQQSLLALQPTWHLSDQLALTAQLLAHSSDSRRSGVEWLYLSWQPEPAWQFRAGKLRTPFFSFSDSLDVGYSYPWITPPVQLYNSLLFPTFKGANASYTWSGPDLAVQLEGLYGYYKGDVVMAGSRIDAQTEVSNMTGFNLNLSRNNLRLRLSWNSGDNHTEIARLQPLQDALQQTGMDDSYNSLQADGKIQVYGAGLSYEDVSSFYRAEWVKIDTEMDLAPQLTSWYASAGQLFGRWSGHLTFARSSYSSATPADELAAFRDDPASPLYPLAAGYYQAYANIPRGGLDSYTLGLRWDFRLNMALKAELTELREHNPHSGFFSPAVAMDDSSSNVKQRATLYQIGWEWVF